MNGNTNLDPGEAADLIPNIPPILNVVNEFEEENIAVARRWAFSPRILGSTDPFDESYIRKLHGRMFGKTWKWAGKYRTTEKSLGVLAHEIHDRIGQLLGNGRHQTQNNVFPSDEIAIRFHYELVVIHPFPNGNGRHARMHADVLIKKLGGKEFTWGSGGNLRLATSTVRERYLTALRLIDNSGDYSELFDFARS